MLFVRCGQTATAILSAIYGKLPDLGKIKSTVAGITSPTMLVGRINGGINTNVVPGKVVLQMDRRMIPAERPAEVDTHVRAIIEGAVAGKPEFALGSNACYSPMR